jgi:hypothetical protein
MLLFAAIAVVAAVAWAVQPWFRIIDPTAPMSNAHALNATVQAAWFQAAGSIGAIFVAIVLAAHQQRRSERLASAERQRQRSHAEAYLMTAFAGVIRECGSKGPKACKISQALPLADQKPDLTDLAELFTLKSAGVLESRIEDCRALDAASGRQLIIEASGIISYNKTLSDLLFSYGQNPSPGNLQRLLVVVAERLHRCHESAIKGILLVDPAAIEHHGPELLSDPRWLEEHLSDGGENSSDQASPPTESVSDQAAERGQPGAAGRD